MCSYKIDGNWNGVGFQNLDLPQNRWRIRRVQKRWRHRWRNSLHTMWMMLIEIHKSGRGTYIHIHIYICISQWHGRGAAQIPKRNTETKNRKPKKKIIIRKQNKAKTKITRTHVRHFIGIKQNTFRILIRWRISAEKRYDIMPMMYDSLIRMPSNLAQATGCCFGPFKIPLWNRKRWTKTPLLSISQMTTTNQYTYVPKGKLSNVLLIRIFPHCKRDSHSVSHFQLWKWYHRRQ